MADKWEPFDYETNMVCALLPYLEDDAYKKLPWELQNAVVEALVLHTRVLFEMLLARQPRKDDLTLPGLMPAFSSQSIAILDATYGGSNDEDTPCWQFNKLMAHATTHRSDSHDYVDALKGVLPLVAALLDEIAQARKLAS